MDAATQSTLISSSVDLAIDLIGQLAKWIAGLADADRQHAIDRARERHGDAIAAHLEMLVEAQVAINEAQAAIDSASGR